MPLFREGRSRRAWRREVAEQVIERLDIEGALKFIGSRPEDRWEMLRIAELLPDDVVAELYEDPYFPGFTFMELRHIPEPINYDVGLQLVYPDGRRERAV